MNVNSGTITTTKSMRERTCCFTGHRFIPSDKREQIIANLERTVLDLYKRGILFYGAGGAIGFDTIAADTILRLRKTYPELKLILVLPCESQTEKWTDPRDIEHYNQIKDQADKIRYTSREYKSDCMYKRNRHLVDNMSSRPSLRTGVTFSSPFGTVG